MLAKKSHRKNLINAYCGRIKDSVYAQTAPLEAEAWLTPEPVRYDARQSGEYRKLAVGDSWGKLWDCAWMHFTGTVPLAAKGKKVVLRIDLSGEGCVVDRDGNPVQGITTFAASYEHSLNMPVKRVISYLDKAQGGEAVDIWVDAACNDLLGNLRDGGTLKLAEISTCDERRRKLYYDYRFLLMLSESLPEDSARREQIEGALFEAANAAIVPGGDDTEKMIAMLAPYLAMKAADTSLKVSAIGHAHIDLAWLWPIRETKRKGARTFSTALSLMKKYPDYVFGASQPQLYQWVKEDYPDLYRRIGERVREGRWECQGAMWVEADTNVAGGEALVRQVLYGKEFFRKEFGKEMEILWLPDVFGYSGALPQILLKSDVPYFMTQKLSWSEYNTFPHNTFVWEGIDGSRVLAHMPPENTYNSGAVPSSLRDLEHRFKDKEVSDEALMLFGIGDGGGGPGSDHLEFLNREKSVAGLPPVKQEPSVDFFHRLEKGRGRYCKWVGELFLEKHLGTYTTQANNKKYNRLMELALRDCEFVCSFASARAGFAYPKEKLDAIWKEVLLYQFHDILPGSSIKRVYDESVERYHALYAEVKAITDEAAAALASQMGVAANQKLIVNTLSFARDAQLELDGSVRSAALAPCSLKVVGTLPEAPAGQSTGAESDGNYVLENESLRAVFGKNGKMLSFFDKIANREALNAAVEGNNLVIYEDEGDCWDMPFTYYEQKPQDPEVIESGIDQSGLADRLVFRYRYGDSSFTQTIRLDGAGRKLVFDMSVDWKETHKMLRARYPVDVLAHEADCNIQFGSIKRPTVQNTSWDYAKMEICAHKWVSVSEPGFGVALINNAKYGYRVWDNVLDLNLLRSPMHPGENADKGEHTFSYELYIHDGDLVRVNQEAYCFNVAPVLEMGADGAGAPEGDTELVGVSDENIVLEAVKQAEDGSGYVFRFYETAGRRTKASIQISGMKAALHVNLIERPLETITLHGESVDLLFKPFEIQTLKVIF